MKIEFGFQANCSELVSFLGAHSRDEVVAAMKRIQGLTGWNWWITDWMGHYSILVSIEALEELLEVDEEKGKFSVSPGALIQHWDEHIPLDLKKELLSLDWLPESMELTDFPADGAVVQKMNPAESEPTILVNIVDDYGRKGFHVLIGDCEYQLMPQFHKIRKAFSRDCSKLGGNSMNYLQWMAYHFSDRQATIRHLERYYPQEGEDYVHSKTKWFQQAPPLPGSGELDLKDMKELREYVLKGLKGGD